MGREIRRVPPDWEHPRYIADELPRSRPDQVGHYRPLCDQDYATAAEKWMADLDLWRAGRHDGQPSETRYFWDYDGGPPAEDAYRERKWTDAEATHYQMYETVSEGTPVTPHFATKAELVEHLVRHGSDWDHGKGWNRDAAERLVEDGWAPSFIMRNVPGQPVVIAGPEAMTHEIVRPSRGQK